MSATCPKCKAEDQEGEEIRSFTLDYTCENCGHNWTSDEPLQNLMQRGKDQRKYGGLA